MSELAWAAGVALSRGVELEPEELEAVIASVASVREAFAPIAGELAMDDDMYEFRRVLAREAAA
jgi:hypothetical protein